MALMAVLEAPSNERRGSSRYRLRLDAEGHHVATGEIHSVVIHNISSTGLLIETEADLAVNDRMELVLPEAGAVAATIIWRRRSYLGVKAERPMTQSAIGAALVLAEARTRWNSGRISDTGAVCNRDPLSRVWVRVVVIAMLALASWGVVLGVWFLSSGLH